MKLLFSCNYAVIANKSWKSIEIITLPILPRTLQSYFARLSLLSIGLDIMRMYIVWWCKSMLTLCMRVFVCVREREWEGGGGRDIVTERCRLISCNICILVYIIGNKKNCAVPYDSCVFIFGRVGVFLVFDSRLQVHEIWSYRWHMLTPQNVAMKCASTETEHIYLFYWNRMQLCIISVVSGKCVEIPVESMISINGQEICIVHKSVQCKIICLNVHEDIWQFG
jgi:hypothetical protein